MMSKATKVISNQQEFPFDAMSDSETKPKEESASNRTQPARRKPIKKGKTVTPKRESPRHDNDKSGKAANTVATPHMLATIPFFKSPSAVNTHLPDNGLSVPYGKNAYIRIGTKRPSLVEQHPKYNSDGSEVGVQPLQERHAMLLFAILAKGCAPDGQFNFQSLSELMDYTYGTKSGAYTQSLSNTFDELQNIWCEHIKMDENKPDRFTREQFKIIESWEVEEKWEEGKRTWKNIKGRLYHKIVDILSEQIVILNHSTLLDISGANARIIFMYIPARCNHPDITEENPYRISISQLMHEICWYDSNGEIPKYKSKRLQLIFQRGREGSIFNELDGRALTHGFFRWKIEEQKDDFYLLCWVEKKALPQKEYTSKFASIAKTKGWSEREIQKHLSQSENHIIEGYEKDILDGIGFDTDKWEAFLLQAKSFMGIETFQRILYEVNADTRMGSDLKSPSRVFVHRLISAFR